MALSSYTRNDLLDAIRDATADSGATNQVNMQDTLNHAVRQVYLDVDLRGAKRKSLITPNIFDDIYMYTAPSDLKDVAIIDVRRQTYPLRNSSERLRLVSPEEFDRKKNDAVNQVAVIDDDLVRTLLLDIDPDDTKVQISSLDALTGDGSNWAPFSDGVNIVADTNNKIQGGGSLKFDLTGSATTAGIYNAGLTRLNVGTDIFNSGIANVWAYVNDTTNLTSYALRLGINGSNYHQTLSTGTDIAGAAIVNGWNLLKWDWKDKTTTGTVDPTKIAYAVAFMTKTSGKSDDGYRFDDLQCHTGSPYEIFYYSKYPWQNASQTYLENSTSGTDYLNVSDSYELDLIAARCRMELARRRKDYNEMTLAQNEYNDMLKKYKQRSPTERLRLQNNWY